MDNYVTDYFHSRYVSATGGAEHFGGWVGMYRQSALPAVPAAQSRVWNSFCTTLYSTQRGRFSPKPASPENAFGLRYKRLIRVFGCSRRTRPSLFPPCHLPFQWLHLRQEMGAHQTLSCVDRFVSVTRHLQAANWPQADRMAPFLQQESVLDSDLQLII